VADEQTHDEPLLLDDMVTASDLKSKVQEAWQEFASGLARAITGLASGVQLEITLDPTATGTGHAVYEVSVQKRPDGTLGALAVGNAGLPEDHRLDRSAVAEMVVLGWSPPGVIEGSGRDFGMLGSNTDTARFAIIVTKTLRDIFGAPHPAFLMYTAHDEADEQAEVRPLGTARHSDGRDPQLESLRLDEVGFSILEDPSMPLDERVRIVVAGVQRIDPDTLAVDSDGDIGVRAGSAMVFVRVKETPPLVDVFSPILTDVKASEKLYTKLSELTTKMPVGRLYYANDTVWASVPVFGRDFQPTHLMLALQVMTGLADELDDRLHGEFGGRRFFAEAEPDASHEPKETKASDTNTGMYL
jgi:T3SS (YopN, CesT) and YbjN peptide-binding chaperone 1/T3SS (YopN, CesT) and YbjN peptide-binding chaperone 3